MTDRTARRVAWALVGSIAALGGDVAIRSAPSDGTTVAGRLPVEVSS
jgi:hypothetical protein